MIKLGTTVRDKITGFTGIAVSKIEYLTGCSQIGVSPKVDKDGKVQDSNYFDLTRLETVDEAQVLQQTSQDVGGPNRDCPK